MGPRPDMHFLLFFCFLWLHLCQTEVPRLGVKWEQPLPAYTTATATQDPNHIYDPQHSSQPRWFLNPLSEARDQTRILMDTRRLCYC